MKCAISRKINFFDIGPDYRITLGALIRLLQEASGKHSDDAENALTAPDRRWILNRISGRIERYPEYATIVEAVTWLREIKGFKAFRDYELYADGCRLAAATTVWLYFDLTSRRLLKVPADTGGKYGIEPQAATPMNIDAWRPDTGFAPDHATRITTRPTDYDPLRHVNNAVYFDYLATLLMRSGIDPSRVAEVKLQYQKEIGPQIETVDAGLTLNGRRGKFKIFAEDTLFAAGEVALADGRQ